LTYIPTVNSEALAITNENYDDVTKNSKVAFINFYADWCMFSQQLAPIFHKTADALREELPDVKLGRVDCESETAIAEKNGVNKYPTIKVWRNGKALRMEYRGQRSVDAFTQYIKNHLKASVTDVLTPGEMAINTDRNTFVGYFTVKDDDAYKVFSEVCDEFYETLDCIAAVGDGFKTELAVGENLVFKAKKSRGDVDSQYTGSLTDINVLRPWLNDKANPLIREITFENGEELTEEGLPFLIMFHSPGDVESIKRYKDAVIRELLPQRENINFLTADGSTFSHPLHHLGKSADDLPLVAIDSFRHMYLFKKFDNIDVPGKLTKFVQDLHSGKLHQDFHNPPMEDEEDQVQEIDSLPSLPKLPKVPELVGDGVIREHVPTQKDQEDGGDFDEGTKQPPETIFQKLAPSDNRYTLLHGSSYRDEL